jgi:release factor glutamine methyltransferase
VTADPGTTGDGTVTWRTLWSETAAVVGARNAGRWLCEAACGLDGDEFLDTLDEPATERMVAHLDAMLARWRGGEPLQYVLGRWGFRRLDLLVDRRVLIPRPETETLVDVVLEVLHSSSGPYRIADLGTGSGAIGLALADELPLGSAEVWLTDVSEEALDVARANLAGIGRRGAGVRLAAGSWFDALAPDLAGTFDVVVANPPYVEDDDPALEPIVREWEPPTALFAGADGLDAVRSIGASVGGWLRPGGTVVVEIGATQGERAAALLRAGGLIDVEVRRDLTGRDRVVIGRRQPDGVGP